MRDRLNVTNVIVPSNRTCTNISLKATETVESREISVYIRQFQSGINTFASLAPVSICRRYSQVICEQVL
jgi:hypothetical protein